MEGPRNRVLLCLALLLGVTGSGACDRDQELPLVSLAPPLRAPSPDPEYQDGVYRIGAAPIFSPVTGFEQYAPTTEYLSERLGRPVAFTQRSTYFEINEMVRAGELVSAFVCTGALLFNGEGLEPLVTPVIEGAPEYRAVCLVPRDSPARRLEDLAGAAFAVTDPLSLTGRAYIHHRLSELGTDPDRFFQRVVQAEGHDTLVRLVSTGAVDGGCVNSLVLAGLADHEPELANQLRVLEESGAFAAPPAIVSESLDPRIREELRAALVGMALDEEGRAALDALGIERFDPPALELYEATRETFLGRDDRNIEP